MNIVIVILDFAKMVGFVRTPGVMIFLGVKAGICLVSEHSHHHLAVSLLASVHEKDICHPLLQKVTFCLELR